MLRSAHPIALAAIPIYLLTLAPLSAPPDRTAPLAPHDSLVTDRYIVFGRADRIRASRADLDAAVADFKRGFGDLPPRIAVLLAESPGDIVAFDFAALRARGLQTLPFLVGGEASILGEVHLIGHEACHLFYITWVDARLGRPAVPAAGRGAQEAYGHPLAPDWLDEAAATLCETGEVRQSRQAALRTHVTSRIPLAELLTMEHPGLPALRGRFAGAAPPADGKPQVVMSVTHERATGAAAVAVLRTDLFYAEAQSFAEFLLATRGATALARVSDVVVHGQPATTALRAPDGAEPTVAALEAEWIAWSGVSLRAPATDSAALTHSRAPASDNAAVTHWVAEGGVAFAPWTFDLTINGSTVTGSATQGQFDPASGYRAPTTGPFPILDGKAEGDTISFTLKTANGGRIVTFKGIRDGNRIMFTRSVTVVSGDPGRDGILGASGATRFTARLKDAGSRPGVGGDGTPPSAPPAPGGQTISYGGFAIDIGAIAAVADRDAVLDALRGQLDLVNHVKLSQDKLAFMRSVPIVMKVATGAPAFSPARYDGATRSVVAQPQVYDRNKPIILHELLHAYHHQRLPGGFDNADVIRLFQQARASGAFPEGSYLLSNPGEYFAMMASVYLHGSAARDPFVRDSIRIKQPDCYRWLEGEFGARE